MVEQAMGVDPSTYGFALRKAILAAFFKVAGIGMPKYPA
jgi:hypothetical protein